MTGSPTGEFTVPIAGDLRRFDTRLGTIVTIEDRCGDASIVEIVNRVVFGRRSREHRGLIAAALVATGAAPEEADACAGRATLAEAEGFVVALMGALGFEIAPRRESAEAPLAGGSSGGAGGSSPSVPSAGPRMISGAAPGPVSSMPGPGTVATSWA